MSVVIETTLGDITVDLFVKERPSTCKNFLKLCKLKYYNFSLFHTVQANFIAQTGDPTGLGTGGESIFGILHGVEKKYYEAESLPKIKHTKPGLLSMVNCGNNMLGSQFFVTLGSDLQSLDEHCVFAEVTEGQDVLLKLNDAVCDLQHRPYRDIRITHTVILEDPFEDLPGMQIPSASPDITLLPASNGRLGADEEVGEELTGIELQEAKAEQEARARATILEIVGDIPHAEIAPPENVLFVCKLNPVTNDDDLELIFSRFGKINSCEVIRDHITGESLQYAFIEFADKKSCEQAYLKMDNVLIDDRRIHVDFSQSVTKIRWKGKGRGVELVEKPDDNQPKPLIDLRYSSMSMMSRGRDQQHYYRDRDRDRRGRDDRRRDDGRRRRDDDRRGDDRRRDDDRRRRPIDRHDSRRQPESSSSSRRHRDYADSSSHSDSRFHRRHEELMSQESNHRSNRQDSRDRNRDQPSDHKSNRIVTDKGPLKSSQDNGDANKVETAKIVDISPVKLKTPPPIREEEKPKEIEDEIETEMVRNEVLSQSMASDVGSVKHSIELKKKVNKKKSKRKRRRSSTSSISSDSSVSSSSSSSTSSSSSSSSSSRERIIKKNGKCKRHKHGTLTKKYYDRKGKLIKVIKKHRKNSSSSSDSSSDFSDTDRKRSKKKHKRKKKKKYSKSKRGGKKSSDEEYDSEDSGSDGGLSKSSKTSDKLFKKRKLLEKAIKTDRIGEVSLLDEEALSQSPDKKKLKMTPTIPLKKS